MWFIGVEVEQETSAPPPKKILDPPLSLVVSTSKTRVAMRFPVKIISSYIWVAIPAE